MKTGMIKQVTAVLGSIMLFAACSPKSQSNSSYQNSPSFENSNIIGGVLADSHFQKTNGIVQLIIVSDQGQATCTGSLIARNVVLTAAHCLVDPGLQAIAVVFALDDQNASEEQVIYANKGIVHPSFEPNDDNSKVWNDIALLRLEKDAPEDFLLAQLPAQDLLVEKSARLTLAGFGITNAVVRKVIKDKKGNDVVVELPSRGSGTLRRVSNIVVTSVTTDQKEITLDQTKLRGACHGDSGGPALLKQTDGSYVQVGVTSRGTNLLGNCNESSVYTGLAGHLDWIAEATEQMLKPEEAPVATLPEVPGTLAN